MGCNGDDLMRFQVGDRVRNTFDGRGLAEIVDWEQFEVYLYEIRYLPDHERTSECVVVGETEWANDDLVAA
jgi:hypothetical protein